MAIGATDKKLVSAISLLDQREIAKSLVDIHNDEGLVEIFEGTNRYKVAKQGTYHQYVNESIFKSIDTTGATVTGSGSATVTTASTAGTKDVARVSDLVKFPNGKVGYISAITRGSTDAITIKSVDGSNLTHTAGQKLALFSNAHGERSKSPENRTYGMTKYYNNLQIFREVNEITDVQNASTIEVEFNGQPYIVFKDMIEKALKLKADINGAFFGGVRSATVWSDASPALTDAIGGGALQTTGGLDWYITSQGGVNDSVASAGTVTLADIEEVLGLLVAAKSPNDYIVGMSRKAKAKVDNFLKGLNSSGVTSGHLNLDGKNMDFQVNSFEYMGFKLDFTTMGILDNQEMFAQTDIVKSAYFIPRGKVKVVGGADQERIQARYFKNQVKGGNDVIGEWEDGALATDMPRGAEHVKKTYWSTTQGLEVVGTQHFAKYGIL